MWDKIKGFFTKSGDESKVEISNISNEQYLSDTQPIDDDICAFRTPDCICSPDEPHAFCAWANEIAFDASKPSIIIIDDNPGMVSFLKDDLEFLDEEEILNLDDYNLITFETPFAAFDFKRAQTANDGLNIKFAILDITLGGSRMTEQGNIKYTGVDIFEMILNYNSDVKALFYTGNQLNPHIKASKKLIEQYTKLTDGKDIKDHILYKTSMDMDDRRKFFAEFFTN